MAQEILERISKDLEQEKESPAKTFTAKHSNLRSKREAEQEHGDMESEIDDFKAECEKGNEDKANCDSYNEWLSWKEAQESQLNKISNEQSNLRFKRKAEQEHGHFESEIDDFKAECEKGNEDKANCDSYNEWLSWKEAHESQLNKISNDHSSLRFKRKAEQEHGEMESEIDDFKAECEKGNEDKANCDSYNEWLSWKEAHESQFNKISNDHSSLRFKRKAEQEHGEMESEIDDFKAECEEGNEDKATCDSYNEWLSWKEAHESQLNKISNEQSNLRFKRKAEQEHGHFESEIDDFKAECEEGNEDKATCDSYNEWLSWKEAHESQLNKISNEQSNLRFKRKAEQEHGHFESEIDDFKAECEEGNEDKATCDSYNEWLSWKEAHESQLNKISNDHASLRFKRKAEQEHGEMESEIDDFKAECEKGNEDKANCDSYNEWLSWKEAHESQLNKISNDHSSLRFKRKAEQEHGEMESEIDDFKAECEKGNEDKANCDSYNEWLSWKEAHESQFNKISNENSNLRFKREVEKEPGKEKKLDYESSLEISDFKKACKEGAEDKDTCESFYNLMKEKEEEKKVLRRKRDAKKLTETEETEEDYKSHLEISDFEKACKEGTEDKETCDSFYNLMKVKDEEINVLRRKRNTKNIEKSSISDFKKDCDDGKEDQETCDSYFKWIEWKKNHDIFLKRNNENEFGDHLNNRVGKAAGKDKQTIDSHENDYQLGDSEKSDQDDSELRKLDAKIRADLEEDDAYFAKISKGRSSESYSSADGSRTFQKNSSELKRRSTPILDGFEAELDEGNDGSWHINMGATNDVVETISGGNKPVVLPRKDVERIMDIPNPKRQRRTVAEVLYRVLSQKKASQKRGSF